MAAQLEISHAGSEESARTLIQPIRDCLAAHGWQGRMVAAGHLVEIAAEIEERRLLGELDEKFFQERLSFYRFAPPAGLESPHSVLVVALPRPAGRLIFHRQGRPVPVIVPPTYVKYSETGRMVAQVLNAHLNPHGVRFALANLPYKLLAARSGLACYGKNNILYVPGMGSFFQLAALFSDLLPEADAWQEARMLARCERCHACQRRCPTSAIGGERFLLHAERCITYLNESPEDFRRDFSPSWQQTLVGCMRCQEICPENRGWPAQVEELGEYSDEETALILSGASFEALPTGTAKKWSRLGMGEDYGILVRNLRVFFSQVPTEN